MFTYRSGPIKHRVSNNRLLQIRAGGRSKSKFISAGSQISAGGGGKWDISRSFCDGYIHIFSLPI